MKFIILGCGSSMGVPRPDGYFGNCDPKNKKNYRTRCSALIKTDAENVLIDTSPDLRYQLIKNKIKSITRYVARKCKKFKQRNDADKKEIWRFVTRRRIKKLHVKKCKHLYA